MDICEGNMHVRASHEQHTLRALACCRLRTILQQTGFTVPTARQYAAQGHALSGIHPLGLTRQEADLTSKHFANSLRLLDCRVRKIPKLCSAGFEKPHRARSRKRATPDMRCTFNLHFLTKISTLHFSFIRVPSAEGRHKYGHSKNESFRI